MQFAHPYLLLLLLLLVPYIIWYLLRHRTSEPTLQVSSTSAFRHAPRTFRQYLVHAPFLLRCLSFLMIVLVLCRPQTSNSWSDRTIEGIDIMLCLVYVYTDTYYIDNQYYEDRKLRQLTLFPILPTLSYTLSF